MSLNKETRTTIQDLVSNNKVVLFMKGTPQQPMCGFSAKTVAALSSVWPDFSSVNVLDDENIREGIKEFGNWPTIPQLYIDGELVGGSDIVSAMLDSGELHQQLGVEPPDRTPPELTITDAAAEKIREAMQGHDGVALHLQIDANWDSQFNLAPAQGDEIAAETNGMTVLMDIATAQRAKGASIDWIKSLNGEGLSLNLPKAPPPIKQLSVKELSDRLSAGDIVLIDVRNSEEREKAALQQALVLDQELMDKITDMPRDTELAFMCHHGNASMGAAEYFRKQGFTRVFNVAGGIDAWSQEVDNTIPQY